MVVIGRHIDGITINPLEYVLDKDGKAREFEDVGAAKAFLRDHGFTDDEIYWFVFKPIDQR